jgi:LuxR family transcriptional regulator, maltose regulon positive regulatory protein
MYSRAGSAADPLVATKLRPPRAPENLVARPRLLGRLERDLGRRLTLLSAPAGFGKTTLLGEWVGGRAREVRPAAWVSLDEGDNDPVRFLSYLVAALQGARGEGFGEGVLAALRSAEPPRMEAVLGVLVNEIANLPGETAIILDDYHLIDSEAVHATVSYILDRLPETAHLVLSGRVEPPLPLARLRARGQMAELHAPDLRFTLAEAAEFLGDAMGLDLSAEDAAALEGMTEGWIAALQLAAHSMRGREDISGFVRSFSGGHRDVFDFLAEEVLSGQNERVQSFLLETSILDSFSAPLCDAVTGHDDGRRVLDTLEREHLFLVPLDDDRVWYRYHHLFADFLRGRLERERPRLRATLHRRASGWCEENGLVVEAVGHALQAGDHEWAARLIEGGMDQTWYRGELVTLLGWLRALPEEAMRRRPLLMVWYAAVLMLEGRLDGVDSLLDEAEAVVRGSESADKEPPDGGDDPQHVLATAAAVRSLHAGFGGDPATAVEHARRALSLLPDDNLNPRPFAALCLAEAQKAAGDPEAAAAAFAETARLGRAAGHDYIALASMGTLAQLEMERGRLREADALLRQALDFAVERGAGLMPAVGRVRIGLGELLYEKNDLDAAERELSLGVELAERAGELDVLVRGRLALSRVRRARGDAEGALGFAYEAERMARDSNSPGTISEVVAWTAWLRLMLDDTRPGADLEQAPGAHDASRSTREAERLLRARLLIAAGEPEGALRLVGRPDGMSEEPDGGPGGRGDGKWIRVLAVRALALWAKDDKTRALESLRKALTLGEPEGYVRTFVDEGPVMAALLAEALEDRQHGGAGPLDAVSAPYLRKLLAALERETMRASAPSEGPAEPLSEREREVLQLIAAGKTNRQVATELFVSVGTVKTHVNNLYRKLDTHSRTQAVASARELGLI